MAAAKSFTERRREQLSSQWRNHMPFPRGAREAQQREWFGATQPANAGNSGAAPVPDCSIAETQLFLMSANLTVGAPINPPAIGSPLCLVFVQDAIAGRTLAWNAAYRNAPALAGGAATAGQRALTEWRYDGASWEFVGGAIAFA
jgi:hypothetical protein